MGFADFYFRKFDGRKPIISQPVENNLSLIITIPCFKEKNIVKALESLYYCYPVKNSAEVIVILNYPEQFSAEYGEFHQQQYLELQTWSHSHSSEKLRFHVLLEVLPVKDAGVGLARKIAMDEALNRFNSIDRARGIIAGFDADCSCSRNYLRSLEQCFEDNNTNACSVYFEHATKGLEFSDKIYEAITYYEIYLRYYIEVLRKAGFPYSFHTLGSSFGVTAEIYAKQGGMNKRKAGEDFYFLHKVIPAGAFVELNHCTVYPSARESDRVPFGTGAAVNKIIQYESADYPTFSPESFEILGAFILNLKVFYKIDEHQLNEVLGGLHDSLKEFLERKNFKKNLSIINSHCVHFQSFEKAFFQWFNGLMVLQYLNESHESHFCKLSMSIASKAILRKYYGIEKSLDSIAILETFRNIQNPTRLLQ